MNDTLVFYNTYEELFFEINVANVYNTRQYDLMYVGKLFLREVFNTRFLNVIIICQGIILRMIKLL